MCSMSETCPSAECVAVTQTRERVSSLIVVNSNRHPMRSHPPSELRKPPFQVSRVPRFLSFGAQIRDGRIDTGKGGLVGILYRKSDHQISYVPVVQNGPVLKKKVLAPGRVATFTCCGGLALIGSCHSCASICFQVQLRRYY
jgi:hypothetical protein